MGRLSYVSLGKPDTVASTSSQYPPGEHITAFDWYVYSDCEHNVFIVTMNDNGVSLI